MVHTGRMKPALEPLGLKMRKVTSRAKAERLEVPGRLSAAGLCNAQGWIVQRI